MRKQLCCRIFNLKGLASLSLTTNLLVPYEMIINNLNEYQDYFDIKFEYSSELKCDFFDIYCMKNIAILEVLKEIPNHICEVLPELYSGKMCKDKFIDYINNRLKLIIKSITLFIDDKFSDNVYEYAPF